MRPLSEIRQELADKLNSNFWSKLKSSLIGKELIAFGARLIQEQDAIVESINSAFDYTKAGRKSLISISHSHYIGISFVEPSYVRVRISSPYDYDLNLAPFQLRYELGNLTFYNTKYVTIPAGTLAVADLYLGTLKAVGTKTGIKTIFGTEFNVENPSYVETQHWAENTVYFSVVSLGNVIPDSVSVLYMPTSSSSSELAYLASDIHGINTLVDVSPYFLYTLSDGTMGVYVDTESLSNKSYGFTILYLEPSAEEFDVSGLGSGTLKVPNRTQYQTYQTVPSTSYEIIAYKQGNTDSLEYAREMFRKRYLEYNIIASEDQLRQYVNSFPAILDSAVKALNNNVTIYVKPINQNAGPFGDIELALDTFGTLLSSYFVELGNQVEFGLKIWGVPSSEQTSVSSALQEKLAYEVLPYTYKVSVTELAAFIQNLTGTSVYVTLDITANYNGQSYLPFKPKEGTIKIYDDNNDEIGHDANGVIYGISSILNDWNAGYTEFVAGGTVLFLYEYTENNAQVTELMAASLGDICVGNLISQNNPIYAVSRNSYYYATSNHVIFSKFSETTTLYVVPTTEFTSTNLASGDFNGFLRRITVASADVRNNIVNPANVLAVYTSADKLYYLTYTAGVLVVHYCSFASGTLVEIFAYSLNYTVHGSPTGENLRRSFLGIGVVDNNMVIYTTWDAIILFNFDSIAWTYTTVAVPWRNKTIPNTYLWTNSRQGTVSEDSVVDFIYLEGGYVKVRKYKNPIIAVTEIQFTEEVIGEVSSEADYMKVRFFGGPNPTLLFQVNTNPVSFVLAYAYNNGSWVWKQSFNSTQVHVEQAVGSINYQTGYLSCSMSADSVNYESSDSPNLDADSYLTYNESIKWES